MGDILKALDRNENVTLTYRGHEKATIVPKKMTEAADMTNHPAFGLWEKRSDMDDVNAALRSIRKGRINAI
jgi:hypothetical protein